MKFGNTSRGSSFDMDRAEGGTKLVSAELRSKLDQHGESSPELLQTLWDMNIWSSADLHGIDSEVLVQVGSKQNTPSG